MTPIPTEIVGLECVVYIKCDPAGSDAETYEGKLIEVDDDQVRLLDPAHSVRRVKTTPVLSALPLVGDRFTSIGAASEQRTGTVTISRAEILAVEPAH